MIHEQFGHWMLESRDDEPINVHTRDGKPDGIAYQWSASIYDPSRHHDHITNLHGLSRSPGLDEAKAEIRRYIAFMAEMHFNDGDEE